MPGCTSLIKHRFKLSSEAVPKHFAPYRLSSQKKEWLRNEIDKLLKEGIVEHSNSEFKRLMIHYDSSLTLGGLISGHFSTHILLVG